MLEFLTAMTGLFEEIIRMPTGALKGVVKLRGKVITLLGSDRKKARIAEAEKDHDFAGE